ncbi:MAG: hydrogenase maturation nickel metallochaperone HypA [Ktedonobacteraceae bacterium]
MHELAIAEQIVQVVMTQVEAQHIEHVANVRIQVGEATGVVADSLSFSFEMIASSTPELVGAQLVIDTVPYRAKCRQCHKEFPVKHFIVQCPTCETWEADVISGTEFKVLDMETA